MNDNYLLAWIKRKNEDSSRSLKLHEESNIEVGNKKESELGKANKNGHKNYKRDSNEDIHSSHITPTLALSNSHDGNIQESGNIEMNTGSNKEDPEKKVNRKTNTFM